MLCRALGALLGGLVLALQVPVDALSTVVGLVALSGMGVQARFESMVISTDHTLFALSWLNLPETVFALAPKPQ
ncbi:hypothetical protein HLV40_16345 [Chromohalobacter salexigens]|nr:hypothetical protein [Chromohalobacter salexigens]